MRDKAKIYAGVAIFLALFLFPVWYNSVSRRSASGPEIVIQTRNVPGKDRCVMQAEYMRSAHMTLLRDWREAVVRSADRSFVRNDGRRFRRSLTDTCMDCHSNKSAFCDRCHDYTAVQPDCWNCHIAPIEEAR